ncbi:UNVERIFIED_ORG: hypothetical protein BCL66_11339 [Martelella mediterranea]
MYEFLPLIAFQSVFVAAGLTILYRIIGGRISPVPDQVRERSHRG